MTAVSKPERKNGDLASYYYNKVELNSPVLELEDFDLLQNVIRALRRTGVITVPYYDCGAHTAEKSLKKEFSKKFGNISLTIIPTLLLHLSF